MNAMILEYFIFLSVMIILLWINKMLRHSFFTISNYLIITYIVITGIQVIACFGLRYKTATLEYWLIIIFFIIITVITDLVASRLARRIYFDGSRIKQNKRLPKKNEKKFDILCVGAAAYSMFHFIRLAGVFPNIYYVVQDEFQSQYAGGIYFYIRLIMMIATVYYWGCSKVSKKNIALGFVCLMPNMLTFVKGIVFIPCLASILLRLKNGDIKISFRTGITVIVAGIIVFFGVYLVEMGVYNPDIVFEMDTYKKIGSKLIDYLISGVQSFSQNISEDNFQVFKIVDNVTLAPFINCLSKFGIGESIDTICTIWQRFGINAVSGVTVESNVNTYIGTLYLYNGLVGGCILNMFWVFISSFLDEISIGNANIIAALSSLFCAAFTLGWFDYYFMQTFWVYLIGIAFLIELFLRIKLKMKY